MEKIEVEIIDKHRNYLEKYISNDLYWGIGIENEVYLEFEKSYDISDNLNFFLNNAKRERYSIDYFTSYKNNTYKSLLKKIKLPTEIPILLNAHSFSKVDTNQEHKTINTKDPIDNPKFNGKTLYDLICEKNSYFKDEYMKSFIFDGDTIEFVTNDFYKTTINNCIQELSDTKLKFISNLKSVFNKNKLFQKYGEINFCKKNHPFVSFMTNLGNYSIFNNMTYHFNFTLPTKLNSDGYIENYRQFIDQHKNAANLIQIIEPILIAIYGSGDILSNASNKLTNTSQRCAKSRYISIGTYDTSVMMPGKILQIESENNHLSNLDYWFFNRYYNNCDYTKEKKIGLDINFHKHKNHGLELRFFDYFEEDKLEKVLIFIVLLLDLSLENTYTSPVKTKVWNDLVYEILLNRNYKFNNEIKDYYKKTFNLDKDFNTSIEFYNILYHKLFKTYSTDGICFTKMVKLNKTTNCCIIS